MSQLGNLEAGSRHDLRVGLSPDAPDEAEFRDDGEGAFGYVHSYETSSRYDGPGLRVVLFVSGCLLRCTYCHNPDTWHLKDGTYVSAQHVIDRLGTFAPALRSLDGGLTISGGEPMVQLAFTRRILAAAKQMGLHTAIETSGFLGDRADDKYLSLPRSRAARHQERRSGNLSQGDRPRSGADAALRRAVGRDRQAGLGALHAGAGPHRRSRQRRRIARFVAPMKNVEWVEVQPFHQLGAFKWKAMKLEYKHREHGGGRRLTW